jgi:UDP-glucose 4-epimerase
VGAGHHVRVLDDLSTGSALNLEGIPLSPEDRLIGDVRDTETVRRAMGSVEVVFHLAALPSVARSVADPMSSHSVNAGGTLNVLQRAREAGVRRVVYASSSSVYGNTPTLPKHEDMPVSPMSPYAASKLAGEVYCRAFASTFGLETVCLRFFNVFGPRQDPASDYAAVIPRFVSQMMMGKSPIIFGDGRQTRDFTFVDNVVQACVLAAGAGADSIGEAINVGCGDRFSVLDLISVLNELLGTELAAVFEDSRRGDVRDSQAEIEKARSLLGYAPMVDFRNGLASTIRWFSTQGRTERLARPSIT